MAKGSFDLLDPGATYDVGGHPVAAALLNQNFGTEGDDDLIQSDKNEKAWFEGGGGNDVLRGGKRDDYLDGQAGDDRVLGSGGEDKVKGGDGNDFLEGGKGNDKITGGAGDDVFDFSPGLGKDKVTDFEQGHDRLDFVEALRDTDERLDFSDDIDISYHDGKAIIETPAGKIVLLDFHGELTKADFNL